MRVEFRSTTRIARGVAYGDNYQSLLLEIEREGLLGRRADPIKMAGMFRAAQVVRKRMRATVPPIPRTGRLKSAIRARRNPRYREALITIENAPHWFIIEFGRKPGVTPEGRSYPGAPPYPFIIPSVTRTEEEQLVEAVKAMRRVLERTKVRRANRITV